MKDTAKASNSRRKIPIVNRYPIKPKITPLAPIWTVLLLPNNQTKPPPTRAEPRTTSTVSFLLYMSEMDNNGTNAMEFDSRCLNPECRKGDTAKPISPSILRGLIP